MHVASKIYASPLLWLPCELLVQTASYLSPDDLFRLRLTCHHVETFLFATFSEEFFSDRRFMVTDCLRCLLHISKHPHLSKSLSKLTIGLDRLLSSDALQSYGLRTGSVNQPHVKTGVQLRKLGQFADEQNWLVSTGQIQLLLGEALNNLPNVAEISLRDTTLEGKSSRPGSRKLLVSYGLTTVCRQTGISLLEDDAIHSLDRFADMVFSATLLAVVRAGKQLKAITVDIQKQNMGLSSSAFVLPQSYVESFWPTLQALKSLDLSVSFTHSAAGSPVNGSLGFLFWQYHHLFSLLECTPNLVSLRVRSKGQSFLEDGIIGWLAHLADLSNGKTVLKSHMYGPFNAIGDHIPESRRLRALKELELGNMIAPVASISKALLHLAGSLRKLYLHTVVVSVARDDDELDKNPRSPNAWATIFRRMSGLLNLEELEVCALGHQTPTCSSSGNRHQVAFLRSDSGAQSGPRNGLLNAWSYTGGVLVMKSFLLEVAEKTVIICSSCKEMNPGYMSFEDLIDE
ncbi:hypothetical protein GGR53DRAFT_519772 [Hypoxylon sp. FL1150]|nr:hypothetical protein GGR53DRAFT_519772 [Hypoxylon sp. FL1150]